MYVCMYVCMYLCMYVCMYVYMYLLMYVACERCKIRYGGWNNTSVPKLHCVLLSHAKKEDNICTKITEAELFLCTL